MLMAILVLGLSVYFSACGGGGGSNNAATFSNSDQAAASAQSLAGALSLSSTIGSVSDVAESAIPPQYAPSFTGAVAVDTSAVANIDPLLKTALDKMLADLNRPELTNSISKASPYNAASLASSVTSSVTCTGGGYVSVSGIDSSLTGTGGYKEFTIDVTYNNCIDSQSTVTYNVVSGVLHAQHKVMLDGSSKNSDVTATGLSLKSFASSTLQNQDYLDGTFNNSFNVVTAGSNTTGSSYANGTFSTTDISSGSSFTFGINKLSGVWSKLTTTTDITEDNAVNGSLNWGFSAGQTSINATLSFGNLNDDIVTDASGNKTEGVNGSIGFTWTPTFGLCVPGTLNITTVSPIYTPFGSSCPTKGTLTINNAAVQYGVPLGIQVTVTVGGTSKIFTDCHALGGGQCI